MKIKTNDNSINETSLNNKSNKPVKSGDTTFKDDLKSLDEIKQMQANVEDEPVINTEKTVVLSEQTEGSADLNNNSYVYISQNLNKTKNEKEIEKNTQLSKQNSSEILNGETEKTVSLLEQNTLETLKKEKTDRQDSINVLKDKTPAGAAKIKTANNSETVKTNNNKTTVQQSDIKSPQMIADELLPVDGTISKLPHAAAEEFIPTKIVDNKKPQITELQETIQTLSTFPKPVISQSDNKTENNLNIQSNKNSKDNITTSEIKLTDSQYNKNINNIKTAETILNADKSMQIGSDKIMAVSAEFVHDKPSVESTVIDMKMSEKRAEKIFDSSVTMPQKYFAEKPVIEKTSQTLIQDVIQPQTTDDTLKTAMQNDILSKILNDDVDLNVKIPAMEQIVPEQLRPKAKKDAFSNIEQIQINNSQDKVKPLEELKTFLNETMSKETVESLKLKDATMQDENVMLTEEIRNYYNLNKAEQTAVMDDIKSTLTERVSLLEELSKAVTSTNEAREISKELKSIESKPTKNVETKSLKVTEKDATFFAELVKNSDTIGQVTDNTTTKTVMEDLKQTAETQRTATVSKALADMINEASKTNKPFRIDFDKDVSVIIKVDKDGKISAEFIPGDKAVEQYLRNSMPLLKQKFDDEQIDYKELNYRQSNKQNKEKRNKENKDE